MNSNIIKLPVILISLLLITGCEKKSEDITTSPTEATSQPQENYETVDMAVITMKYVSNPFEVRKSLGKKIQTEMFANKFIDERTTAMVIDGNFGFYCRMKGEEYGQHNQIGTMVVRGTLAEDSSGRIGLDNCTFVSNQSSAAAADADAPAAAAAGE